MVRRGLRVLLLGGLLLSLSIMAGAQDTVFTVQGDGTPAIPHGAPGDWDGTYTDPGAVFYYDGLFRMFRNGFKGWPVSVQVGYLTSEDGVNWTEASQDPVFTTDEVPYAKIAMLASSALVEDDGTWVLYFYTWNTQTGRNGKGAIGRATAEDPLGPWTPDPEPVLMPGSEGEWDGTSLAAPSVVKTKDGYLMWYSGYDSDNNQLIGMATSDDGITWTKYDDPTTTEAPYAESDPVLVGDADWEHGMVHQPRVVATEDGYVMLYRSNGGGGGGKMRLGIATSADGITWTKDAANPVFDPHEVPGGSSFWYTGFVLHDDTYYTYIESNSGGGTNIFVVTHDGPFDMGM